MLQKHSVGEGGGSEIGIARVATKFRAGLYVHRYQEGADQKRRGQHLYVIEFIEPMQGLDEIHIVLFDYMQDAIQALIFGRHIFLTINMPGF